MKPKKKFKDTTVGKLLLGAVSMISPPLGSILEGLSTPEEAIEAIAQSQISNEDKIKLQTLIYDQQNKEMESITARWKSGQLSDSWMSKNVRPMVLIWCVVIFTLCGILDSIDGIGFTINPLWNDTFEKVMMTVVLAYFGGRTFEKIKSLLK